MSLITAFLTGVIALTGVALCFAVADKIRAWGPVARRPTPGEERLMRQITVPVWAVLTVLATSALSMVCHLIVLIALSR